MEEQVNRLVEKTWNKFLSTPSSARLMIAISGIPGSGKTTLASTITARLNALYAQQRHHHEHPDSTSPAAAIAVCISMDGYHLSRAQLAEMSDPVYAAARRGAAFTFDPLKFLDLVRALREPLTTSSAQQTKTLYAPSFDHAVKDPVDNDIPIPTSSRVIIFEGNYLSLNKPPWDTVAGLMDELWFVDVGFEVARERLVKRHLRAGIARDEDEARRRAEENDLVNGREILENRLVVQEVVVSREDGGWGVSE
ncbi:hypothetical protein AJ80_02970 [Polytolypa hystricis UAMH7299]|uniref:Nephrocystin 3-like N-terminal domain-containing protein n=1 Tax=Polytolypa hystricis (strain UAMH7299) TaxID=1447883 RepID=A0A2B7YPD7_POLH7|nr:hypothetical protein AJ80_02970 [Polytolypa hystricis UAMH7299]